MLETTVPNPAGARTASQSSVNGGGVLTGSCRDCHCKSKRMVWCSRPVPFRANDGSSISPYVQSSIDAVEWTGIDCREIMCHLHPQRVTRWALPMTCMSPWPMMSRRLSGPTYSTDFWSRLKSKTERRTLLACNARKEFDDGAYAGLQACLIIGCAVSLVAAGPRQARHYG